MPAELFEIAARSGREYSHKEVRSLAMPWEYSRLMMITAKAHEIREEVGIVFVYPVASRYDVMHIRFFLTSL